MVEGRLGNMSARTSSSVNGIPFSVNFLKFRGSDPGACVYALSKNRGEWNSLKEMRRLIDGCLRFPAWLKTPHRELAQSLILELKGLLFYKHQGYRDL